MASFLEYLEETFKGKTSVSDSVKGIISSAKIQTSIQPRPKAEITGLKEGLTQLRTGGKGLVESTLTAITPGSSFVKPELEKRGISSGVSTAIGLGLDILAPGPDFIKGGKKVETAKEFIAPGTKKLIAPEETQKLIQRTSAEIKPELESVKGAAMTQQEVIEAAKSSDVLRRVTTREQTL